MDTLVDLFTSVIGSGSRFGRADSRSRFQPPLFPPVGSRQDPDRSEWHRPQGERGIRVSVAAFSPIRPAGARSRGCVVRRHVVLSAGSGKHTLFDLILERVTTMCAGCCRRLCGYCPTYSSEGAGDWTIHVAIRSLNSTRGL